MWVQRLSGVRAGKKTRRVVASAREAGATVFALMGLAWSGLSPTSLRLIGHHPVVREFTPHVNSPAKMVPATESSGFLSLPNEVRRNLSGSNETVIINEQSLSSYLFTYSIPCQRLTCFS